MPNDESRQLLQMQVAREYRRQTAAMDARQLEAFRQGIWFLYECYRALGSANLQDIEEIGQVMRGGKDAPL